MTRRAFIALAIATALSLAGPDDEEPVLPHQINIKSQ